MRPEQQEPPSTCPVSCRALDVGFDLRRHGVAFNLAAVADGDIVAYDAADGRGAVVTGTRDEIATALARAGYRVVTAMTSEGREVRCEPSAPTVFRCQPLGDNYWIAYPSTAAALAALADKSR